MGPPGSGAVSWVSWHPQEPVLMLAVADQLLCWHAALAAGEAVQSKEAVVLDGMDTGEAPASNHQY